MNTPITDAYAWYGGYVTKRFPVLDASKAREIERSYMEANERARCAEAAIEDAHRLLDELGAPRLQPSGMPFSVAGRLRAVLDALQELKP